MNRRVFSFPWLVLVFILVMYGTAIYTMRGYTNSITAQELESMISESRDIDSVVVTTSTKNNTGTVTILNKEGERFQAALTDADRLADKLDRAGVDYTVRAESGFDLSIGSLLPYALMLAAGIAHMQWPCRMETVMKDVIVDGAHNPDGIAERGDQTCIVIDGNRMRVVEETERQRDDQVAQNPVEPSCPLRLARPEILIGVGCDLLPVHHLPRTPDIVLSRPVHVAVVSDDHTGLLREILRSLQPVFRREQPDQPAKDPVDPRRFLVFHRD